MFDRIFVTPRNTEYVPYAKEVHEHRAPTDDSIKLYEEIKEKAYKSILNTISVSGDNSLSMDCMVYYDMYSFGKVCKYRVKINGQEVIGKFQDSLMDEKDTYAIIQRVIEDVSKTIAAYLVHQNMQVVTSLGGKRG